MNWAYRIEDLSFSYGESPVLEVDKLEIAAGEIVALAGPNGSGKTTLLHLLAFVEAAGSGTIVFFSERSTKENVIPFRRRVGLLLQNPYLFHSTVLKNITWGLKLRGESRLNAEKRALDALRSVGLSGFEYREARTLSGGETQRVALARALVLDPDVLLLDEPANHMDQESIRRTEEIVKDINENHRKTVILTTHDIPKIQQIAHRVLHLRQGRVVPVSPENLFAGRLADGGTVFQTGKIAVQLPVPVTRGSHMAMDPTKIRISATASEPSSPNSYCGKVVSLSAENGIVSIKVDAGERFQVTAMTESAFTGGLHLGQEVWLTPDADGISIF
jgi:tungstate transport system ATP-binding protein